MNIIDRIEISYFRSVYKIDVGDVNHLNIISGSNDVGKSNILKALNLYFDGFTDWSKEVLFEDDVNKKRLEEVRSESIKGKQIIWIAITFDVPNSYDGSLPEKIRVKKKWDRYNNEKLETNLKTKEKHDDLPSTIQVARRFLSHFMNRIEFEYIPAVREESFKIHIIKKLQDYILDDQSGSEEISEAVTNLENKIDPKIGKLRDDFERITGIDATVSPPASITSMFKSFNVSTGTNMGHEIPLGNRGDGIQSQYLISVLRHIYSDRNIYPIWAFEEPENSLEYSRVKQLADDLEKDSKNAQIFATTHSPALVNVKSELANIFRVYKDQQDSSSIEKISPSEKQEELEKDIGIDRMKKDVYEDYKEKVERIENMESKIEKFRKENRHRVLVEGKSDKMILEIAYAKIYDEEPEFEISAANPGPGGGASMLSKFVEATLPTDNFTTIAVFDRDSAGISRFQDLSDNFDLMRDMSDVKVHSNGSSYALLLPQPEFRKDDRVCIEKMFEDHVLLKTDENGRGLNINESEPKGVAMTDDRFIHASDIEINGRTLGEILEQTDSLGSGDVSVEGGKTVFAENIVPSLDAGEFEEFEELFERIHEILDG